MLPQRVNKFRRVAFSRQSDLTVILENVTDSHNIGAVLRSCDSVGVHEMFVLNTEPHLATDNIVIGKRTSSGSRKWVDIHYYTDPEACFAHVRRKCKLVLATKLGEDSSELYKLDLTQSVAFLFGNEHSGLTKAVAEYADGNFIIPQVGMVESLNISVACAVTLYEAFRQRIAKGFYEDNPTFTPEGQEELFQAYVGRHKMRSGGRKVIRRKA